MPPPVDQIDSLDNVVGVPYHHDGPYEATLASRNRNKKRSPVEAVRESNMEALKATPYENVQDSLVKHVPLQGTASIPSGQKDLAGRTMNYEEGADLMRETDAPGGAYRRYEHIAYLPEDYKGKGEPSFTIEKGLKDHRQTDVNMEAGHGSSTSAYEMQPGRKRGLSLQHKDGGSRFQEVGFDLPAEGSGVRRSNTTGAGNRLEGLKRRLGSLRRKDREV
ncbi:hypothetical protein BX600DRAFT_506019 [Xylariales sp. PMI_506]|nr:hypothetical protein BX600DRAFT_506019 [Xylariales sp. PMI_506]